MEGEIKQDKPLSEWTLGEVKGYCNAREKIYPSDGVAECSGCKLYYICNGYPEDWELSVRLSEIVGSAP